MSEILKRPDAGLNYSVGDEFMDLSRYEGGDADYGDGDVVFFQDSATDMREPMTYRNGRITGLGDMPLDALRAIARGEHGVVPGPAGAPVRPCSAAVSPRSAGEL